MDRNSGKWIIAIIVTFLCIGSTLEAAESQAIVHLQVVGAYFGDEVEEFTVHSFKRLNAGKDYASAFDGDTVREIPYGLYRLMVVTSGFRAAVRYVDVYQPEVWVVVGMDFGSIGESPALHGTIKNPPDTEKPGANTTKR